jgi:hypothetical protein
MGARGALGSTEHSRHLTKQPGDAVVSVLAETGRRLEERQGWLRVHRQDSSLPVGLAEATLGELFDLPSFRAFGPPMGRCACLNRTAHLLRP